MGGTGLIKFIFGFGLLLSSFEIAGVAAADDKAPLHYAFEAGQTYVYDLSIQVDLPQAQQTLTGLSKYEVKSVDATTGQMTLTSSAGFVEWVTGKYREPGRELQWRCGCAACRGVAVCVCQFQFA